MTLFELFRLSLEPIMPPFARLVRKRLVSLSKTFPYRPEFLDVGGRRSGYTTGVPANIRISELFRKTDVQRSLNLGINLEIIRTVLSKRSNILGFVFDDMTQSTFRTHSFDCIIAIEVLEHVEKDSLFIKEVKRVLKPNGYFFMTTPNGDFVKNTNPDHKRHYTKDQLQTLLKESFPMVEVEYAIPSCPLTLIGVGPWTLKRPWRMLKGMGANVINRSAALRPELRYQPQGTLHLIATARKVND